FPDASAALAALSGYRLAILSNGTPSMLDSAIVAAGLAGRFDAVWSVDAHRIYKPSPAVYQMAEHGFGLAAQDMLFVSSNAWDAVGAKAAGYVVCWCNRAGEAPDALGLEVDFEVSSLEQLATLSLPE